MSPSSDRSTGGSLWTLTVGLTLAMTSLGVLAPVIPRRLGELGAGVTALSLMAGAYAAAQLVAAPVLGRVGDHLGRRPVLLVGLISYVIAAATFAAVDSVGAFVAVNGPEGALAAGMFPAATVVVADLTRNSTDGERTRWVGVVTASYAVGFLAGPLLGGIIAGRVDTRAAAWAAAAIALMAVLVTATVCESQPAESTARAPRRERHARQRPGHGPRTNHPGRPNRSIRPTERCRRRAHRLRRDLRRLHPLPLSDRDHPHRRFRRVGLRDRRPRHATAYLDRTAPAAQASVLGIRTATMAAGGIIGPLALAVVHPWASPSVVFSATAFGLGVAALTASVAFRTTPTPRSSLDRTARTVRSDLSV